MKDISKSVEDKSTQYCDCKSTLDEKLPVSVDNKIVAVKESEVTNENPKAYKERKRKTFRSEKGKTSTKCSTNNSSNAKDSTEINGVIENNFKPDSKHFKTNKSGDETITPQKINAFQFMMNNRHKSIIGQNSPGKDQDLNNIDECISNKQIKSTRKKFFENWADLKGASKRKREYDEMGNCINYKLEKRAKKLKKLLKFEGPQSDDEIVTRKRRCAVIESDDDNDGDSLNENEKIEEKENDAKKVLGKNKKIALCNKSKAKKLSSSTKQLKTWKIKLSPSSIDKEVNLAEEKSESLPCQDIDKKVLNITEEIKKNDSDNNCKMLLRTRKTKPKIYEDFESDDEKQTHKDKKDEKRKILKVAPVFLKSVSKPKLDPEIAEARRQFLLSGVPTILRKEIVKQQSDEDILFNFFPVISHIQQKNSPNSFWNLPKANLKLKTDNFEELESGQFTDTALIKISSDELCMEEFSISKKIKNYAKVIDHIKSQNPNFPVYKMFKSLYCKSGYKIQEPKVVNENKSASKKRGRKKKNLLNKSVESVELIANDCIDIHAMWTEKYKARNSGDIFGSLNSITSLKEWLQSWLNSLNETKKKTYYDSESDFDIDDSSSRDSTKMFKNTVILKGPNGSGKTTAVYAVCNELGFNVLEVNASSKRTGKWLLQELQEATQSHQVREKEKGLLNFVEEKKETKNEEFKHKMCVLLVEDVDIVFEQDEGFTVALMQIITTTKRPIILTTNDGTLTNMQKILTQCQAISFSPLSSVLTIWLQIICLIEGYYVKKDSIEELLNFNKGDIRRTLLHLQLWITSGGNLAKTEDNENESDSAVKEQLENELIEDDNSNLSDLRFDTVNETDGRIPVHHDCVVSFESIKNYKLFALPYFNNVEIIWWNLPNMFNLPNFSNSRLQCANNTCSNLKVKDKMKENRKLKVLSNFYDSLVFTDVLCGRNQFHESLERTWYTKPKDSLELEESAIRYNDDYFVTDLTHTLLSGSIKMYKENYENDFSKINMGVPSIIEKRWRCKQVNCQTRLKEALLPCDLLERKSISLDYMPCLRAIARSEVDRATTNVKRGNRFYNYLRSLGVNGGDSVYKIASTIFKPSD